MKYVFFYGSPLLPLLGILLFFSCAGLPRAGLAPAGGGKDGPGVSPEQGFPAEKLPDPSLREGADAPAPEGAKSAAAPRAERTPPAGLGGLPPETSSAPAEKAEVSAPPETPPAPASREDPDVLWEILLPEERAAALSAAVPQSAGTLPREDPRIPPAPKNILGKGLTAPEKLAAFLLLVNPGADPRFTENLAETYVDEAGIEGVNHDAAFAQMCLETGFLKFGGLVTPEMNNFCGLGSTGPGQPGERFPDTRTGVRAHIQHLKVYATPEPLKQDLVDPRYHWVRPGSSPEIGGLAGTWAADRAYGDKIKNILTRLYEFSF